MPGPERSAFDLKSTYVHLSDGPAAVEVPVGPDFWERIGSRADLQSGRLVTRFRQTADWPHWELHPAGEEVLHLISGALELVLEKPGGERSVMLRAGDTFIVPRGTWHRGIVHEAGELLGITYGAGTQHRPR
ncbi:MAG: cupin domain-containing protein [Polyangia bacterium]